MTLEIRSLLEKLPHKIQVSFALYCAEYEFSIIKEQKNEAKLCIDLIKEWLESPDRTGLEEELRNAAFIEYTANHSAINAAAHTAAYVVDAAANATYAAHAAAFYTREMYRDKIQEYYGILVGYLTKVEKDLYLKDRAINQEKI
jgi:hypothetical protein